MFRLDASKQLGHFFNSYTQSINKAYNRTGPLFESPFERKVIPDEKYIIAMIHYCHNNPVKHEFVKDWRDWEFSSYHSLLNGTGNSTTREKVMKMFGDIEVFEKAHLIKAGNEDVKNIIE